MVRFVHSYHLSCKVERIELKYTKKKGSAMRPTMRFVCLFDFLMYIGSYQSSKVTKNKQTNL